MVRMVDIGMMKMEIMMVMVQITVEMVVGYVENDGDDHHYDINSWDDKYKKDKDGDDE